MSGTADRSCPYHEVIDDILALARQAIAYEPDEDTESRAVALVAQLRAIAFVNRFHALNRVVPRPSIRTSAKGGVVFRWVARGRMVEVVYQASGGLYRVFDTTINETMVDGPLEEIDPLHDIVASWVLGQRPAETAYADAG
jgi:hypothetical protein